MGFTKVKSTALIAFALLAGCAAAKDHLSISAADQDAFPAGVAASPSTIADARRTSNNGNDNFTAKTTSPAADLVSTDQKSPARGGTGAELVYESGAELKHVPDSACSQKVVDALKKYSPVAYQVWQLAPDKSIFNLFAGKCASEDDTLRVGLATAVHETNHYLRDAIGKIHLASGELMTMPAEPEFFAPKRIAASVRFVIHPDDDDGYFGIYIADPKSAASSQTQFTYLLDELNAYTNDLRASADLASAGVYAVQDLSGVPALMSYTAMYMNYARTKEPATWRGLTGNPAIRTAVGKLWAEAEDTLKRACAGRVEQPDSLNYLSYLCTPSQMEAMGLVLGRAPVCPSACRQR